MVAFAATPTAVELPGGLGWDQRSALLEWCAMEEPNEACGLIVSSHGVNLVIPVPNASEDPRNHVTADERRLSEIVAEYGMDAVVAVWHSHPPGAVNGLNPSNFDRDHRVPGIFSGIVFNGEVAWYAPPEE